MYMKNATFYTKCCIFYDYARNLLDYTEFIGLYKDYYIYTEFIGLYKDYYIYTEFIGLFYVFALYL